LTGRQAHHGAMPFEIIEVSRYQLNCSLVWCEQTGAAAVIDPGGDHHQIFAMIDLLEVTPEVVLITHGHFDHAGQAKAFAERAGVPIVGPHRGDAGLIASLPEQGVKYGAQCLNFEPDRWLDHGDVVRIGTEVLDVVHVPGHCRGHVAYVNRRERHAFVGDILFHGAIGAWEHPDGDLVQLVTNIRHRLFPLGDDIVFVPGHGPTSTFGHERLTNPFVGEAAWQRWQQRFG